MKARTPRNGSESTTWGMRLKACQQVLLEKRASRQQVWAKTQSCGALNNRKAERKLTRSKCINTCSSLAPSPVSTEGKVAGHTDQAFLSRWKKRREKAAQLFDCSYEQYPICQFPIPYLDICLLQITSRKLNGGIFGSAIPFLGMYPRVENKCPHKNLNTDVQQQYS